MAITPKFISLFAFTLAFELIGCSGASKKNNTIHKPDSLNNKIIASIDAFNNRTIHKVLTTAIIDSTPDKDLLEVVFDNLAEKLPKNYKKEYPIVLSWTKAQQAIFIIEMLEGEVDNGGFNQYYYNYSGQYADLAPAALRLIGAIKFSNLTARANNIYKKEKAKITKNQDGTIERFSKSYEDNPLNKFDNEFYELEKKEDLQKLRIDFIRKNKSQFADN